MCSPSCTKETGTTTAMSNPKRPGAVFRRFMIQMFQAVGIIVLLFPRPLVQVNEFFASNTFLMSGSNKVIVFFVLSATQPSLTDWAGQILKGMQDVACSGTLTSLAVWGEKAQAVLTRAFNAKYVIMAAAEFQGARVAVFTSTQFTQKFLSNDASVRKWKNMFYLNKLVMHRCSI